MGQVARKLLFCLLWTGLLLPAQALAATPPPPPDHEAKQPRSGDHESRRGSAPAPKSNPDHESSSGKRQAAPVNEHETPPGFDDHRGPALAPRAVAVPVSVVVVSATPPAPVQLGPVPAAASAPAKKPAAARAKPPQAPVRAKAPPAAKPETTKSAAPRVGVLGAQAAFAAPPGEDAVGTGILLSLAFALGVAMLLIVVAAMPPSVVRSRSASSFLVRWRVDLGLYGTAVLFFTAFAYLMLLTSS